MKTTPEQKWAAILMSGWLDRDPRTYAPEIKGQKKQTYYLMF
jgi:hypothetical protein